MALGIYFFCAVCQKKELCRIVKKFPTYYLVWCGTCEKNREVMRLETFYEEIGINSNDN